MRLREDLCGRVVVFYCEKRESYFKAMVKSYTKNCLHMLSDTPALRHIPNYPSNKKSLINLHSQNNLKILIENELVNSFELTAQLPPRPWASDAVNTASDTSQEGSLLPD